MDIDFLDSNSSAQIGQKDTYISFSKYFLSTENVLPRNLKIKNSKNTHTQLSDAHGTQVPSYTGIRFSTNSNRNPGRKRPNRHFATGVSDPTRTPTGNRVQIPRVSLTYRSLHEKVAESWQASDVSVTPVKATSRLPCPTN